MKTALMTLSTLGLVFALAGPSVAASPEGFSIVNKGTTAIVQQKNVCKDGEKWDEKLLKCVDDKG